MASTCTSPVPCHEIVTCEPDDELKIGKVRESGSYVKEHRLEAPTAQRYVVKSGHRMHLLLSFCLILLQFSSILLQVIELSAFLPLLLPFYLPPSISPSQAYIFRSRVIKSAPEGMCLNRISLILPGPLQATKTQKHKYMHVHNQTGKIFTSWGGFISVRLFVILHLSKHIEMIICLACWAT